MIFTLYENQTQYEITVSRYSVLYIRRYNWSTPEPEEICFQDCPDQIQDQILEKLNEEKDSFE
jgi:predicted membrane GTPase involved in stress response